MKERKTRIGMKAGFPIVSEMLTNAAIFGYIGESCQWLRRLDRREKMKPHQVAKLNEAIWGIAEQLAAVHIDYNDDRQQVIDQIKQHLKPVKLKFVYEKHLGKDLAWWTYRTRALKDTDWGRYTFTEEEVLKINFAIADIVNRLLSIELVAEEEF